MAAADANAFGYDPRQLAIISGHALGERSKKSGSPRCTSLKANPADMELAPQKGGNVSDTKIRLITALVLLAAAVATLLQAILS